MVGRGNLVFPSFCRILEALRVEWQNSTPRFALTLERRNGNMNLSKYSSLNGDVTHNQSVLQPHFVSLRHDWPLIYFSRLLRKGYYIYFYLIFGVWPSVLSGYPASDTA